MSIKITVIGGGPGGYIAAVRAARKGAEVTLIEKGNVGGTCLNRGCIPSKIMKTAADLFESIKKSDEMGITVEGSVFADMNKLMRRKQKVIDTQVKGIEGLLKHNHVKRIQGTGTIKGDNLVEVTHHDGTKTDIRWDKLIVATGSEPLELPALPFNGSTVVSSNEILNLSRVPASVAIVGGGVIGCEFAFILNALGSDVTIIEGMDRALPLPSVDEDCSKILQREMKKRKIRLITGKTVSAIDSSAHSAKLTIVPSPFSETLKEKDREPVQIEVEMAAVCVGRTPNTDGLGLENAGVRTDAKGWIVVDDMMRTGNPDIYAIGDAVGPSRIMLAHVASAEGITAAENALGDNREMDYTAIPSGIFTMPEIGCTGLSEKQAGEAGINVKTDSVLFRTIGKAQVIGEIAGQAKIISDADTGRVAGVHIIGPHATDLIAEGTLAVKSGTTVGELSETIHAHPTLSEIMLETAMKASGNAMHG